MLLKLYQQLPNQHQMPLPKSSTFDLRAPLLVAVIASAADLKHALRIRRPPDFFELRLDALHDRVDTLAPLIPRLRAPVIITARHPREGGRNSLSAARRRDLLLRFLPLAACLDVELRSAAQAASVLAAARAQRVRLIISVHSFANTPSVRRLAEFARDAEAYAPDIFKIAARIDTENALDRLLAFFDQNKRRTPTSAMGVGRLGRSSRILFARHGSVLNYAHLGHEQASGQLSLTALRRHLSRTPGA
jgi:3-dehydroquinate dehydratase-1